MIVNNLNSIFKIRVSTLSKLDEMTSMCALTLMYRMKSPNERFSIIALKMWKMFFFANQCLDFSRSSLELFKLF